MTTLPLVVKALMAASLFFGMLLMGAILGILRGYIDQRNHRNHRRMFTRPIDERGVSLRNVLDRVLQ